MPLERVHGSLIHITDLHANPRGRDDIPQGRTDTYHEDCAFEWDAFRTICRERSVGAVLMSGDFFNLKNSNRYLPRDLHWYSDTVESFGIPWYVMPGNHDLPQASMANWGVSALKALIKMTPNMVNVMQDVAVHTIMAGELALPVTIAGTPYGSLEHTFTHLLPDLDTRLARQPGYRIGLVHTDAMPPGAKPLPGHWDMASYDDLLDALPTADLVCAGHIHHGGNVYSRPDPNTPGRVQRVSKPFSFGRVVKDYFATTEDMEQQHVPTCTLLRFESAIDANGAPVGHISVEFEELIIPHIPFAAAFQRDNLAAILRKEGKTPAALRQALADSFVQELKQRSDELDAVDRETEELDKEELYRSLDIAEDVRALIDDARVRAAA